MKLLILICSFLLLTFITGCSSSEKANTKYYWLIVDAEENISDKFSKFISNDYSVVKLVVES